MEKTEMMKWYESETEEILDIDHMSADANGSWYGYIEELEADIRVLKLLNKWSKEELIQCQAKATAYDKLMSGGRKTLKEMANFLGKPVTVEKSGAIYAHEFKPHKSFGNMWVSSIFDCMQISPNLIDFNGDWEDSLTLPDGWEER